MRTSTTEWAVTIFRCAADYISSGIAMSEDPHGVVVIRPYFQTRTGVMILEPRFKALFQVIFQMSFVGHVYTSLLLSIMMRENEFGFRKARYGCGTIICHLCCPARIPDKDFSALMRVRSKSEQLEGIQPEDCILIRWTVAGTYHERTDFPRFGLVNEPGPIGAE